MQKLAGISYIALSLFHLSVIGDGLIDWLAINNNEDWVGLRLMIVGPIGWIVAFLPLIGTIASIFSAVNSWHWSWLDACTVFLGLFFVVVIISVIAHKFSPVKANTWRKN